MMSQLLSRGYIEKEDVMKKKHIGYIIGVAVLVALLIWAIIPSFRHRTEYYFMNQSLNEVRSLAPKDIDYIDAVWMWGGVKIVRIYKQSEFLLFLSIVKYDLYMDKHERGKPLGSDKIVIHLKSGETIDLNYWFSPKQNGKKLVSQTVRSRGKFKPFIMSIVNSK